ncbi:MAG: hypothetical protein U0136_21630 [Bdellovibrionota bacterium]
MEAQQFPEGFVQRRSDVRYDSSLLRRQAWRFDVTRRSPQLHDVHVEALRDLAEGRLLFPCVEPRSGRTLYAELSDFWPVEGLKMKGAAGLVYHEGRFYCEAPRPHEAYGVDRELHLAVGTNLDVQIASSKRKAVNSLRRDSANCEFDCQMALAQLGIGFPGLLAGEFIKPLTGEPERDFDGSPTGAVFVASDPGFVPLGNYAAFRFYQLEPGVAVRKPTRGPCREFTSGDEMIRYALGFIRRIGELKARCELEAGVGRHACHLGNLLYNESSDRLLITDTDSCVLIRELPLPARGPQVLRDLVSDLFRTIKDFMLYTWSDPTLDGMRSGDYLPVHSYLDGYFAERAKPSTIRFHADRLHAELLDYVALMSKHLWGLINQEISAQRRGRGMSELVVMSTWIYMFVPFYRRIFGECYALLKDSNILGRGYPLPHLLRTGFDSKVSDGLKNYLDQLLQSSRRTKAELGWAVSTANTELDERLFTYLS